MLINLTGPMPFLGILINLLEAPFGDPFVNYITDVTIKYDSNVIAVIDVQAAGYTDFISEVIQPTVDLIRQNTFTVVSISDI